MANMAKKLDPRIMALVALAAQVVVAPLTLRDIARRSSDELRGPRWLWRMWAGSNLLGSSMDWWVGRRPNAVELVRRAAESGNVP